MKILTKFFVLLVLAGCIFSAGCVISPEGNVEQVVLSYDKGTVDSLAVTTGANIQISLPGNPTTGYVWVVETDDGLTVASEDYAASGEDGLLGSGGIYTWEVVADKPGIHSFFAEYKRPNDAYGIDFLTLLIGVGDASFDMDGGDAAVSVKKGETVTVVAEGNPTTGYMWIAGELPEGLKIAENYHASPSVPASADPDEYSPLLLGAPGVHIWEITAEEAGEYVFAAEYKRFGGEPISAFTVNIKAA